MKSPSAEWVLSILVQILNYYGFVILGTILNMFRENSHIFKFVWLQAIYQSKMAAFKYFVNEIVIHHTGQCYRIRKQENGEIRNERGQLLYTEHFTNVYLQWRHSFIIK